MQADGQGFLIGTLIDTNKRLLSQQDKSLGYLREIRDGVRGLALAPRAAVPSGRSGGSSGPAPAAQASSPRRGPTLLPARGADGKFIKSVPLPGKGKRQKADQEERDPTAPPRPPNPPRDDGGDGLAQKIGEAVKGAVVKNVDGVDPVVSAVKEMREAVSPFGRLFSTRLSPQERRQESWYKRIIQAILKAGSADALKGKQTGGIFSGLTGLLGSLFGGIFNRIAKGLFGRIFGGLFSRLFGGLGGRIMGMFASLGGRMLPLMARLAIPLLTRIAAPIAAAFMGWKIGKWIGDKVYNWLVDSGVETRFFDWIDDMKKSWRDFVDKAAKTWDEITGWVKKKYNFATEKVKQAGRAVSKAATNAKKAVVSGATRALDAIGLGDLIGGGEGGYDSFNHGRAGDARGEKLNISGMTIGEIKRRQNLPRNNPDHLNAVGKYQVIGSTLNGAIKALGLKDSDVFNSSLQERIFNEYLIGSKRPEVRDYLAGKSNDLEAAVLAIAKEWASVQDPRTGKSFYDGVAGNSAPTTATAIRGALVKARQLGAARKPVIPDAPRVDLPGSFASASRPEPVAVKLQQGVGQNVGDRSIAHITTGGLGMNPWQ